LKISMLTKPKAKATLKIYPLPLSILSKK